MGHTEAAIYMMICTERLVTCQDETGRVLVAGEPWLSLGRTRETPRGHGDNIGHRDVTSERFVRSNDVSKKYRNAPPRIAGTVTPILPSLPTPTSLPASVSRNH